MNNLIVDLLQVLRCPQKKAFRFIMNVDSLCPCALQSSTEMCRCQLFEDSIIYMGGPSPSWAVLVPWFTMGYSFLL
jgi:hypothetical protein